MDDHGEIYNSIIDSELWDSQIYVYNMILRVVDCTNDRVQGMIYIYILTGRVGKPVKIDFGFKDIDIQIYREVMIDSKFNIEDFDIVRYIYNQVGRAKK